MGAILEYLRLKSDEMHIQTKHSHFCKHVTCKVPQLKQPGYVTEQRHDFSHMTTNNYLKITFTFKLPVFCMHVTEIACNSFHQP